MNQLPEMSMDKVKAACRALGYDPLKTTEITMTSTSVEVITLDGPGRLLTERFRVERKPGLPPFVRAMATKPTGV